MLIWANDGRSNTMTEFTAWESFFVIVGSASGALIGLQFIAMTLIENRAKRPNPEAGAAFATPTIIHFCAAFFLSAVSRAPFQTVKPLVVILGGFSLAGLGYIIKVTWRVRKQDSYRPVFEDWLFHCLLPLLAYAVLSLTTVGWLWRPHLAMFGMGVTVLLLLFTGIHNAWDAVTYHVFDLQAADQGNTESVKASEPQDK